ncbi:MAG: alpha-L-glutamate ligase-like protein [Xanthomonadales bacterium]|nr:alpha-L-glutamate ligase-like protein [Xanthomonadales bacterium]
MGLFEAWRTLKGAGVLGLNARNGDYISLYNPRRLYPRVDDKILTKSLLTAAQMPVPELYGIVSTQYEAAHLSHLLDKHDQFALKPAHGAGGDGIMVIVGKRRDRWCKPDGRLVSLEDLEHQVSGILSGMFSLGGHPDEAMLEALVEFDPVFNQIAWQGVPDIRVIVFLGFPVMAMARLPTQASGGRANLHQGAVGVGIDLTTGRTHGGVCAGEVIHEHPDTGASLQDFQIPHWRAILDMAASCHEPIGLGYMGVDIVLDKNRGPVILELNARPGLSIQVANQAGLGLRLGQIEQLPEAERTAAERVELALSLL